MALNLQTFKTRSLSAIVFAVVMIGGLCFHAYAFIGLLSIILSGCIWEWIKMNRQLQNGKHPLRFMLGLLYVIIAIFSIGYLGFGTSFQLAHFNPLLPCTVIFSMWINDTMAYIVGSFIGKTPFSPISPKKTWEGTLGGGVLCVGVIVLLGIKLPIAMGIAWGHWLHISILCAVFGTLGDLLESKMKRMAGIKDSGNILPGHGGFLDRFDSMLLAAPVVAAYTYFFLDGAI